jgi:CRISPR-associated protein Csm4
MRWRPDWQKRGELALQVLGDAGVGGERSSGHGLFHAYGPHEMPGLLEPVPGGRFLTLSLYYPREGELAEVLGGEDVGYRLWVRRGWMASPDRVQSGEHGMLSGSGLRRKAVRMFAEGSILRWPGTVPLGALADVTPDAYRQSGGHAVWRYGYAYPLGYRLEGGTT